MRPSLLTWLLRRDDLELPPERVLPIDTVERGEPEVVLIQDSADEDEVHMQALELADVLRDGELYVYAYVPLAFGPVRELGSV